MIYYNNLELLDNRQVFFKSLVDDNYIIFVIPTLDDLVDNNIVHYMIKHVKVYDVRKLSNLLFKSTITNIEILFSNDIQVNIEYKYHFEKIFNLKHQLAKINLPHLYSSSAHIVNLISNKSSMLNKISNVIKGYYENGFSDIEPFLNNQCEVQDITKYKQYYNCKINYELNEALTIFIKQLVKEQFVM